MVINEKGDEHDITQIKFKMDIIMTSMKGKERNEDEWKKLFMESGFQEYKISPLTKLFSLIEVYP